MTRTRFLVALLLLLAPSLLRAQEEMEVLVLSPGVRFGYVLGEGATYGLDLSLVVVYKESQGERIAFSMPGLTLQIDHSTRGDWKRIHVGAQMTRATPKSGFPLPYGGEIGLTFITDSSGTDYGLGANIFSGLVLYPSIGLTLTTRGMMAESGVYAKLPIPLGAPEYRE